jgi:hypothetical protein
VALPDLASISLLDILSETNCSSLLMFQNTYCTSHFLVPKINKLQIKKPEEILPAKSFTS